LAEDASDDVHGLLNMINEASLDSKGWFKDKKTGLIIQWGTASYSPSSGYITATHPISFPNEGLLTFATPGYSTGEPLTTFVSTAGTGLTSTIVYIRNKDGNKPTYDFFVRFLAIGY